MEERGNTLKVCACSAAKRGALDIKLFALVHLQSHDSCKTHDRRTLSKLGAQEDLSRDLWCLEHRFCWAVEPGRGGQQIYDLLLVYLVTALVPSLTACLASSPGRMRRTEVWTSRELRVLFLL